MNALKKAALFCALAISLPLRAQYMPFFTPNVSSSTSVTVHYGGVVDSRSDSGNPLYPYFNTFTTPATLTSPSFPDGYVKFGSPDSSNPNWGMALYSISGTTATLVCAYSSTTVAVAGWNKASWTCSGSPAPSTTYAVFAITASATQEEETTKIAHGVCPITGTDTEFITTPFSAFPETGGGQTNGWPNTLSTTTAGSSGNGCYALFADLTYTTTAPNTIVAIGSCAPGADALANTCNTFPTAAGHSVQAAAIIYSENGSTNFGAFTFGTDTLAMNGTCSGTVINHAANCLYSKASVAAGDAPLTWNTTDDNTHPVLVYVETAGTGTGTLDANAYDTSAQATPFTGPNLSVTHAPSIGLCVVQNTQFEGLGSPGTWTPGSGWSLLDVGQNDSASSAYVYGVFTQNYTTTGTKNCTGSYSISGTDNITATSTYR